MHSAVGVDRAGRRATDWLAPPLVIGALRAGDCMIVMVAGLLAYSTRFSPAWRFDEVELYAVVIGILLVAHVFHLAGFYSTDAIDNLLAQSGRVLAAWGLVVLSLVALAFVTKTADAVSRLWVSLWFVYGAVGLVVFRALFDHQVRRWQRAGRLTHTLVIAGAGEHGRRFAEHLRHAADRSVRLVGLFDDRRQGRVPDRVAGYPVLGTIDDLVRFARANPVDQVVIALPWHAEDRLIAWMKKLRDLPVDVRLCPDVIGFHLVHHGVTHIGGVPLLNVFERPLAGWGYAAKAIEDRVLAAVMLALAAPFMLLIALAIRLDSPGPALFRQRRYGFNNEPIEVLKFRTMHADVAQNGEGTVVQAGRDDPRVTRVGRWLRWTSLDELPQLLNVLRGEMSIVGPRPHAVAHNEQYAPIIDAYLARHRVKPGITGWAQVNGLRGETATPDKMERRVRYDLYYIENWSLLFDLRIILRTLLGGFTHPNAY